jgi:hypothetical protein
MDKRCHKDLLFDENTRTAVKGVKRQFERVRMPLAKMEVAKRTPGDFAIAFPSFSYSHGISWHVNDSTQISRQELSDAVLDLLEDLAKHESSANG